MALDSNEAILTLVPEVPEVIKERQSSFRVYSIPGDTDSTRYDFVITKIDGTEGVRPILHWKIQVEKLRLASNHINQDEMQAWNNVVLSLLLDVARGSYEHNLTTICRPFWAAAKIAARNAVAIANPAHPTADELAAQTNVHDNCPMPITLQRIQGAINHMTRHTR